MTNSTLSIVEYESHNHQVSWCGVSMADGDVFNTFLTNDVASRLNDKEGSVSFEAHLRSLPSTGFSRDSLDDILSVPISEARGWVIGEAIAEAYLSRKHKITWPWNMARDKRNPKASLAGADLIGFRGSGEEARLVLGEVKTSSDTNAPPGVMNGRSGMTHQIDKLANNLSLIYQILQWLYFRCKDTEHQESFDTAISFLLNSGGKDIALFGVLIRDTQPNELDIQASGKTLAGTLQAPTTCHLTAIYLPCGITDLLSRVSGGGP